MREIKFRAWHLRLKEFVPLHKYVALGKDGFCESDCELTEFTGLKDKNGVEIYEGDIILDHQDDETAEVMYIDNTARFEMRENSGELYDINIDYTSQYIEVIGNIYEHSHLLEIKE